MTTEPIRGFLKIKLRANDEAYLTETNSYRPENLTPDILLLLYKCVHCSKGSYFHILFISTTADVSAEGQPLDVSPYFTVVWLILSGYGY